MSNIPIPTIKIKENIWDISSRDKFIQALTEFNLMNYLEIIKPFNGNQEYYE